MYTSPKMNDDHDCPEWTTVATTLILSIDQQTDVIDTLEAANYALDRVLQGLHDREDIIERIRLVDQTIEVVNSLVENGETLVARSPATLFDN